MVLNCTIWIITSVKKERAKGAETTVEATKNVFANLADSSPWTNLTESIKGKWSSVQTNIGDLWDNTKDEENMSAVFEQTEEVIWDPSEPDIRRIITISDDPDEPAEEEQSYILFMLVDLDGDGDKDKIEVSLEEDNILWYENTSRNKSEWPRHLVSSETRGVISINATDVDEDLDKDIVITLRDGRQFWYENDGNRPPGWVGHVRH